VWDKTYAEFCEALQTSQSHRGMSEDDIETTVKKSMGILKNFNPEKEEGE
jgi:hypothetical protein